RRDLRNPEYAVARIVAHDSRGIIEVNAHTRGARWYRGHRPHVALSDDSLGNQSPGNPIVGRVVEVGMVDVPAFGITPRDLESPAGNQGLTAIGGVHPGPDHAKVVPRHEIDRILDLSRDGHGNRVLLG